MILAKISLRKLYDSRSEGWPSTRPSGSFEMKAPHALPRYQTRPTRVLEGDLERDPEVCCGQSVSHATRFDRCLFQWNDSVIDARYEACSALTQVFCSNLTFKQFLSCTSPMPKRKPKQTHQSQRHHTTVNGTLAPYKSPGCPITINHSAQDTNGPVIENDVINKHSQESDLFHRK